jgi:hypothetical protein
MARLPGQHDRGTPALPAALRRVGTELLIWSSRLLVPVVLSAHLLVAGAVARQGIGAALATLLVPGPAEIFWLCSLDWRTGAGRVVLFGCVAVACVIVLLGLGMVMMGAGDGGAPRKQR